MNKSQDNEKEEIKDIEVKDSGVIRRSGISMFEEAGNFQEEQTEEEPLGEDEIEFEVETDNLVESLLRNVILGYQTAFNKNNEKYEIKFTCTITNHTVQTPDGNKACSYLRLDRSVREKGPAKLIEQEDGKPPIQDEGWETKLLHQEVYFFKSMRERINPKAPWKDQLYLNCLARLVSAGLEYAELLQRLSKVKAGEEQLQATPVTEEQETEERLNRIGLVSSTELPKPLTEEDKKYAEWSKKNNEYGK